MALTIIPEPFDLPILREDPMESGLVGCLIDNECEHGNLPRSIHPGRKPDCGCWD